MHIPDSLKIADLQTQTPDLAETPPTAWYCDRAFAEFDRAAVFRKTWQYVGPASRIPQPGDYLVDEIAGMPLILVRKSDRSITALANVCRHRGALVATADGHGRHLRCHYHGWSYGLDGRVIGTPHFSDKGSLKPHQCQLPKFAAEEWQGMLFVNLAADAPALSQTLGGIVERMLPQKMPEIFHVRETYSVAANWKIYVDNYMEGYHVPVVHPELSKVIDNDAYQYELSAHYSLQWSPVACDDNPYQSSGGHAYYYWIFPNIMLNIFPGRMQVNSVVPVDAHHCHVHFDYYYDATLNLGDARAKRDLEFSALVQGQDKSVCEAVQRGLASGAFATGRLVPSQELALAHFHELLRENYRNALSHLL